MSRSSRLIGRRHLPVAPVKILCASVSRESRAAELEIAERARASNHLYGVSGSTQAGGHRNLQPTVSIALDSLATSFPVPHVLKIDVESHEFEVLSGALRLLERARPIIWCEVDPSNAEAVSELLRSYDYRLFGADADPQRRNTRDASTDDDERRWDKGGEHGFPVPGRLREGKPGEGRLGRPG